MTALAGREQAQVQESGGRAVFAPPVDAEAAFTAAADAEASAPAPASVPLDGPGGGPDLAVPGSSSGLPAGVVRGSDIASKFKPLPREVQAKGRR